MTDENKPLYEKLYKSEFNFVDDYCKKNNIPATVAWSTFDYEAFRLQWGNIKLIFYPHKTSAGNYHIRIRDGGSKDRASAAKLSDDIHVAHDPFCCTFRSKLSLRSA